MRGKAVYPLIVLLALVVAACGDSTSTTTTTAPGSTTSTTASVLTTTTTLPASTTTTLPPDLAAPIELPRVGSYAHVVFTLTAATYSNIPPGEYFEPDPDPGEERHLFIEFGADFEDGYPGTSGEFAPGDFAIVFADGSEIVSVPVDFLGTIRVSDDGPVDWALAFPGDAFDLAGATLRYDDEVHEPMLIPLDGPVPEDPYPIVVEAASDAQDVSYEGGCAAATGTAQLLGYEWDIDGGVDHDGERIVNVAPARAIDGELFLRAEVRSIASVGTCGGTVFDDEAFRLVVDGLPIGPENPFVTLLENGEGIDAIWGWRVPTDATEISLEVGLSGETTATFPIDPPPTG